LPPAIFLLAAVAKAGEKSIVDLVKRVVQLSAYMPVYAKPVYNTVTDELIEAPVSEKDRTGQF
jgi:hypothetical protein